MEFRVNDSGQEPYDAVGYPTDPDGEFIIKDSQFGEQVVREIQLFGLGRIAIEMAVLGDDSDIREHIVAIPSSPGWQRIVNCVGYAVLGGRQDSENSISLRIRDFKETVPYKV